MPLSCAINDAHAAAPDLFQDLIVADSPLAIANIDFVQDRLERFSPLDLREAILQQAIQTKTASDTRCRSTMFARCHIGLDPYGIRKAGNVHSPTSDRRE